MRAALSLAAKDVRVESRGREALTSMVVLALLVVTVGLLARGDAADRASATAGVLWTGVVFSSAVGLARSFTGERDRGTRDVLLSLPVDRGTLYAGKALSNFAFVLIVVAVTLPALALLSDAVVPPLAAMRVAPLLVLGALGVAGVGTTLAALAAETRSRELLLPVLLLPLTLPVLIAGVAGTSVILAGAPLAAARPQLLLLAGYDMVFLAASWFVFDDVAEG